MGNLLFSPSGRIGPSAYMKGIIIIAVLNAILGLLPLISPALATLGIVGLVLFYCFIALGIKRSHDAGKSGWMVLTHILLSLGVSAVAMTLIGIFTGVTLSETFGAAMSGDPAELAAAEAAAQSAGYLLTAAVIGFVAQLVTGYLINMFNKSDPGDNQYGPATIGDS